MVVKDEIYKYVKSPDNKLCIFDSIPQKNLAFLRAFGLGLLFISTLSILSAIVRIYGRVEFRPMDIPLVNFWVLNILAVPLMEEIAFRLPIIYGRLNLSLSFYVLSYLIFSYFISTSPFASSGFIFRFSSAGILAGFVYIVLGNKYFANKITMFWENNGKVIFFVLLSVFTLRHLDNYVLISTTLLFFPFLCLPQLVSGVFLSFVRVRFGFTYSIFFHMMINFLALLPQIIMHYANN